MAWFSHVSRDGIFTWKNKLPHINFLYDTFPEFEFFKDDGSELFYNAWPNVSSQSSYWSDKIKIGVWY